MQSKMHQLYFLKGEKLLSYFFFLSLIFFYTGFFSVFVVNENLFLFIILSPKVFIAITPVLVLYQMVFNGEQSIVLFKDEKARKNYLNKMLLTAFIAIGLVMVLSACFLFFVRHLITEGKWNEPAAISNYVPSILDSLLISFNFILAFIASYAVAIWYISKSFIIKGFDEKRKKVIVPNTYLLYLLPLIILVMLTFIIDMMVVTYFGGGSFGNLHAIKAFIGKAKSWILLIENLILAVLSIYFWLKGIKTLKLRTFTAINSIESENNH